MTKFKCKESFSVTEYDSNGMIECGEFYVDKESVWNKIDESDIFVRLDNEVSWLDLSKKDFKKYFKEVKAE